MTATGCKSHRKSIIRSYCYTKLFKELELNKWYLFQCYYIKYLDHVVLLPVFTIVII